jgi:hypothetical protein
MTGTLVLVRLRKVPDLDAALAFWLLFTAAALAGEPFRQIDAKEIVLRFEGQEFTDEVHWAQVFEKQGSLSSVSMGRRGTGIWRVEDDRLCLLSEDFPERCYDVWMSGNQAQLREAGIEFYEKGTLRWPRQHQR